MSRYGFALALIIGALTFLSSPHQTQAGVASHGLRQAVADSVLEQAIVDPVHYSRRYGWHCGMWEHYGHEHREACWRGGGYWGPGWGHRRHDWDDEEKGRSKDDLERDGDERGRSKDDLEGDGDEPRDGGDRY